MTALDKMPSEIHVLPAWREEGSSGPMHIVAPNFAGTQRYIRADLVPAPPPDVAQAARVLLDAMDSNSPVFAAMVEAAEDAHGAGASFNRIVGNALRAALAEGRG